MTRKEREEAIKWFENRKSMNLDDKCQVMENRALEALKAQSCEKREPKTGYWISYGYKTEEDWIYGRITYKCPFCGHCDNYSHRSNYCPDCGARMKSHRKERV